MDAGNTMIRSIVASAGEIAQWWTTAELVTRTNSRPRRDHNGGGAHGVPSGRPPLDLTALERLDEATSWARLCATACGRAYPAAQEDGATGNGTYIVRHATEMAGMPDLARWEADGRHAAQGIMRVLDADDRTVVRAALLVARIHWRPDDIARILTDVLQRPITAHAVTQARHTGRIQCADDGTVSLQECAEAMRH